LGVLPAGTYAVSLKSSGESGDPAPKSYTQSKSNTARGAITTAQKVSNGDTGTSKESTNTAEAGTLRIVMDGANAGSRLSAGWDLHESRPLVLSETRKPLAATADDLVTITSAPRGEIVIEADGKRTIEGSIEIVSVGQSRVPRVRP
jgi:hypothetical protein